MSKIAKIKAKEIAKKLESSQAYKFDNFSVVCGVIEGYDQAFQDFMEKAENAISMISRHYLGEDYSFEQVWEQFKNYMQDESN